MNLHCITMAKNTEAGEYGPVHKRQIMFELME